MRYTYDPSIPAEPDVFRIYSVYGDSQAARAVSEFRALHPELTVVYEIGMDSAVYGRTLKDVLSDLATRIGAGKGPDVLLMDDLPYEAYAEKGALKDLSALREKMDGETYFLNVIDAFAGKNGLPVFSGGSEDVWGGLCEDARPVIRNMPGVGLAGGEQRNEISGGKHGLRRVCPFPKIPGRQRALRHAGQPGSLPGKTGEGDTG